MKMRRGQVAVYLAMVLLVIAVMLLSNLGSLLAIRSKNRMMNAVDGAAVAAAKWQGALLNEVGWRNVEHLKAAVQGRPWTDDSGLDPMTALRLLVFLKPVEGIARANDAAREWGYEGGADAKTLQGFREHISEILGNPEFYPRDDENDLWGTYAAKLANAIGDDPAVLPRFMEIANPGASGLFASATFYDVLAAEAWCWFRIGDHASYLDQDPSQIEPPEITPMKPPENSEVFSLHVTFGSWGNSEWGEDGFSEEWTNFVCQVTGLSPDDFATNSYATSESETWAFYDGLWDRWSTTFNPDNLPIAGTLKPEYDVAGCVSSCLMIGAIPRLDDDRKEMEITADAKPLGSVITPEGGRGPVTAFRRFIAPSYPGAQIFTDAQLVLVDTVPHPSGVCMESGWYDHVKKHSPTELHPGCRYCDLWRKWSQESYRKKIRDWLSQNAESCTPKGGPGPTQKGGYGFAH